MKKIQLLFWLIYKVFQRGFKIATSSFKNSSYKKLPKYQQPLLPHKSFGPSGNLSFLLLLIFIAFIASIILAIYPKLKNEDTVSEGIIGAYTTKNLPSIVTLLLSDPLVNINNNGLPIPGIAEKWDSDEAMKEYYFTLKNNLYWSDGTKLKSSDIIFNIPNVEVTYPDDQTVHFKMADSFAPFPSLLTNPILKKDSLIGLGQYKIDSIYFNEDIVTKLSLKPTSINLNLPNLVIRFYQDEATAKTAFELGEISSVLAISDDPNLTGNSANNTIRINNLNRVVTVFFNLKDPVLSDDNLRKALSFSAPKIADETRAITSIQPQSWAFNSEIKDNLENFNEANKYLDKSQTDKTQLITLTTTPNLEVVGQNIVSNWKKLGLNVVLRVESGIPQSYQALLISEPIPSDPDQYSLWHSTKTSTNLSDHTFAPRIDKDLEDGRKIKDLEKRKASYKDFQKVLTDIAPAVFLYFPKTNIIYRDKVAFSISKILPLQYR